MTRFILITGCSGGGKSTLLRALGAEGHAIVAEPGRRIVADQMAYNGTALPWVDPAAFARKAIEMSKSDLARARHKTGIVFFDRGLIDAAVALGHADGTALTAILHDAKPYADPVFLAPALAGDLPKRRRTPP